MIVSAKPAIERLERRRELEARLLEYPLAFAERGHPGARLRLESIDAHEAVRSSLKLCHREIAAAQVEVLLYLRAEENIVQGDWARLVQVLSILIRNVVEFSTAGSHISIASTNDVPCRLTLELADHGGGVDTAPLPRDADSFRQGQPSAQQRRGGFRRCLNIARRLAEAQGGTLTESSNWRGKGATFHLTLSILPPPNWVPAIELLGETNAPPLEALYILLVEDRRDTGLAGLPARSGHAFFAAPDMLTGLTLAENCRFDLLFSDITLPDGSGYELMERLRLTQPSLAGIALIGCGMPLNIDRNREAGFSEHLVKPVTLNELQLAIQAVASKWPRTRHERGTDNLMQSTHS